MLFSATLDAGLRATIAKGANNPFIYPVTTTGGGDDSGGAVGEWGGHHRQADGPAAGAAKDTGLSKQALSVAASLRQR